MISQSRRILAGLTAFAAAISACQTSQATTFLWNVPTPGANNWNVNANWNPNTGNPGPADTALFGSIGTSPDAVTPNNVVSVDTTTTALQYTNGIAGTPTFHVTQIPTGVTLTTTNFTETALGNVDNVNSTVAMTGGGTFVSYGSTFTIGNNAATTGNAQATLDLSGLTTFIYSNSTASMLIGWNQNRSRGSIIFASASNNVTVGTFSLGVGGSSNGGTDNANLGPGTNILNANTINIIAGKSGGALQFQNGSGGLRIRGAGGTDTDRANLVVGNRTATGTGTTTGNVFLNGHPVDLKFNALTVGQEVANVAVNGIGVFQFDTGTVDATTLNIAVGNNNATASATGTFTMGGGNLIVGSGGIVMPIQTNGTATATLNINGGTAQLSGSLRKNNSSAAGVATVNLTTATLTMLAGTIGTPDRPIDNLNLTSATLQLAPANNSTNIVVSNFNPVDAANTINITAMPALAGYPSQLPLISYTTLAGGGLVNLGTLPGTFTGYITNDTTVNTVFLVITNGPATSKADLWVGSVNNLWNTTTPNWTSGGSPASYNETDAVTFDDSATTGSVNVSAAHTPLSVTVNNSALNYTFSGSGKISGSTSIVKSGALSLTLTETGGDDFTSGITVSGGTLVLDNAGSAISGGLAITSGATAQIGNNDSNGNIPGNISNDGVLIFNRADNLTNSNPIPGAGTLIKTGNGILTLNTTNTYTGDTLVFKGTLALIGSGSISNSPNLVVSNAAFDISGIVSSLTLLNNFSVSNSVLTLGSTNVVTPLNVSSLTMGGSANTINVSALPPVASYPATVTLIQSAGGISGYNAVLGTLPAASPSFVGSLSLSADQTTILLTLTSGPTSTRASVFWTGSDVPNLNTNWSDRLNWQLPGAPTSVDNVIFGNTATVSDAVTINNVVDANTTISSLRYTNSTSGQWHVTQIPTGVTLTATNVTIGGLTADNVTTSVAMTDGGTLQAFGSSFNVGNGGSSGSASSATADFSALSNFVYEVPTGTFNIGNNNSRSIGNMNFAAASNRVTATTFNFEASAASSSVAATINLGVGTNIFNITSNNIGAQRSAGTLQFSGPTGGIRWRGASGADSDRAVMTLGLRNAGGTSGTSRGRLFFNDHPVDMKLSTLIVGQETANGTPIGAEGNIQFTMGTIDATTISMAIASGNATATSLGTMTVGTNATLGGNATLIVGTGGVSLVNQTLGVATGNLNISGGVVLSSGNIFKTTVAGVANLGITNGSLKMLSGVIGSPAAPIDNLNLDTGTIQLNVDGNAPVTNIVATTITAANITTINIGSIANITAPATVSLISYQPGTADPFANLILGTLPTGAVATLQDNTANSTIDLNITSVSVPSVPPTISKISITGGNIIISGTNNSGAGGTFHVLTSTNIALPLTNWTVLTNSSFDDSGLFNTTNAIDSTKPRSFYILQVP